MSAPAAAHGGHQFDVCARYV